MCAKNTKNRAKLTINHTKGSKKLKRKATEIVSIFKLVISTLLNEIND